MNRIARAMTAAWAKIKPKIETSFRVVVLLLALLFVLGVILLFAGLGIAFGRLGTAFENQLTAMTVQPLANQWLLEILAATGKGFLVLAPASAGVLIARWYFADLFALCKELWKSLKEAARSCWTFLAGDNSWFALMSSLLKACIYVGSPLVLAGLYGEVLPPDRPPEQYVVSATDPVLLPVRLHVNFDNAEIDAVNHELTGRGVTLDTSRSAALQTTMNTLARCVTPDNNVAIRLYGFASEDPFRGLESDESASLNVEAADRRADAVYQALAALAGGDVAIETPKQWDDLGQMERKRNAMIPVPEDTNRDVFADRVVVLYLSNSGTCTVVQNAPQ